MDRAREVAREHRERDAHAQREHRERQMAEQARRQSEYERSVAQGGGHRPPGPGYPGQGYEDQRGQRPGPGGVAMSPPNSFPTGATLSYREDGRVSGEGGVWGGVWIVRERW